MRLDTDASIFSKVCDRLSDMGQIFGQHWQEYRGYIYRCCIKWMGSNDLALQVQENPEKEH